MHYSRSRRLAGSEALLAVWGASSLWSIGELFEQRRRVEKGWFPANPKRQAKSKK